MAIKISLVVPVYNEESNIKEFYYRLKKVLLDLPYSYEIIFINDSSDDNSSNLIKNIATADRNIKIVNINERRGQIYAYLVGFNYVEGDIVITIDADLQYNPEDLAAFIETVNIGFDFVSGYRINRRDPFYRKMISFVANRLISLKTGIKLHDWGCGFNALKKDLIFTLRDYTQNRLFLLKPLLVMLADSVGEVEVRHCPRQRGNSKYSLLNIMKLGLRFLLSQSIRRLKCKRDR
jgi:glycosyltransferase involved in cell wall biosynthesis